MKNLFRFIRTFYDFVKQITQDRITVYASQAAFFLILSAIPLLMLGLNILHFVTPDGKDTLIQILQLIAPDTIDIFIESIIDEVYQKSSGVLISASAIFTLWSASKAIYAIEQGLDQVYGNLHHYNFIILRVISTIYTLGFLVILWLFLIIMMFGNRLRILIHTYFPILDSLTAIIFNFRTIVALCILTVFFMILYGLFPGRRVCFFHQLPGALFSTIGWIASSFVYSIYIDNFSNYSYMYGSLTAIILLMFWFYIFMTILLLGAEINVFLCNKKNC
jgi:membrane protein